MGFRKRVEGRLINSLMEIRIKTEGARVYEAMLRDAERPAEVQEDVLLKILKTHENTFFGKVHKFKDIENLADFRKQVPVNDYESLRSWVDSQDLTGRPAMNPDFPSFYATTSGTTGEPKGALYSHRSMFLHTMGENAANALGVRESDVVLPVVPQFHAMAWGLPYACAAAGADIVMPGPHLRPQPLADLIATERVTVAAGVPTIWNGLYHELKQNPRDISCVRALVVGGSAMPRSLIEAYEKELGVNVAHAWGMTEMSPLGTVSIPLKAHEKLDDAGRWDIKAKQGYPILGVELRIVDEIGRELPWDGKTMGELQVRGPWIISQYFRRAATTDYMTEDGWFRTGDMAVLERGYYRIMGRLSVDIIKSGGYKLSALEIEAALLEHPLIAEVAVIGLPDDTWGEAVTAVVVLKGDSTLELASLRDWCKGRLSVYKIPQRLKVVAELPRNAMGKVTKPAVRALF